MKQKMLVSMMLLTVSSMMIALAQAPQFTYLNAVNFDFENSSGTGYVGHLNIFVPNLTINGKERKFGLNCGIMKINYSKRGDSLNKTTNGFEMAKVNPLDQVRVGMPYHRQYNEFTNTSKNVSWSFYFQPSRSLISKSDFKLLVHAHAEFFVNTWNLSTIIRNIQEVNDTIRSSTLPQDTAGMMILDRFYKRGDKLVTINSSTTKLIFFYGAGFTLYSKVWKQGYLFVQATFGRATDYLSPDRLLESDITNKEVAPVENSKAWFHMAHFEYEQKLSNDLQAVVGVNVRGRFKKENPSYAAYIGLNLGLAGIQKLFK